MLKMIKKAVYPFSAILFFAMFVFVTFALCIDVFVSGVVMAFCFPLRLCKVVMYISEYISDSLESLNEMTSDLGEYSNILLSKKQNKEKSDS
jgi:hypothetical protein